MDFTRDRYPGRVKLIFNLNNKTMTVRDLKELLDQFDDDTVVRLAMQPAWPFEYDISDVIEWDNAMENYNRELDEMRGEDPEYIEEWREENERPDSDPVCYLVEGTQLGYISKDIFE